MATTTRRIGPADHGRRLPLDEYVDADFEEGWLYELGRGVVVVTEVPDIHHGRVVERITELFVLYDNAHPGIINYGAGGSGCRIRLPGMQSSRRPDQAIYLSPPPVGEAPWTRWSPGIVVEVVSEGGEHRDFVEMREEYLLGGVSEYWILDPGERRLVVLTRAGDVWEEQIVGPGTTYRTRFVPGLEVRPDELLGPVGDE